MELLGAGGMGEVYRARDPRLGRDVALKLLPAALAVDADRLSRFRREAQILASLGHPNIGAIFGLEEYEGKPVLVLELVEGETLSSRLRRRPLGIEEALEVARDVALGLEAAHDKGIVHRDLKPENVKLTPGAGAKLLDFGLAKAYAGDSCGASNVGTGAGMVLGTATYMSPEQARGQAVDRRADIWSFGVVLWEMLTGRCPFVGETTSDVLASVLRAELDWSCLPPGTPASVRRLLARCLVRDLASRLRDVGDARLEVEEGLRGGRRTEEEQARASGAGRWHQATVVAAALLAACGTWATLRSRSLESQPIRHLTIADAGFLPSLGGAISPDGRRVVYPRAADPYSGQHASDGLYVRSLGDTLARALPGTRGASNPFFSPDGASVAFFQDRHLWRMEVDAGARQEICEADRHRYGSGFWAPDGTIILNTAIVQGRPWLGLARVPAAGGSPEPLTRVEPEAGEHAHLLPELLPRGRTVVFTVITRGGYRIEAAALDRPDRQVLVEDAMHATYANSGHLVFFRPASRALQAVAFDPLKAELLSSPVTVLSDVMLAGEDRAGYAMSREGTLVYSDTAVEKAAARRNIMWVSRDGTAQPLLGELASWVQPRLSPDGRRLLLRRTGAPSCDLWIFDIERGTLGRLTSRLDDHDPVWSPDGLRVTSSSAREIGAFAIHTRDAEQADTPEVVESGTAPSWSRDGRHLAYTVSGGATGSDIWVLTKGPEPKKQAFLATDFDEDHAAFSPDGRWIAYDSDESGRMEVYLRPYPGPGGRMQVSGAGGQGPLWSQDGREIFFENDRQMMAVQVTHGPRLRVGTARPLFGGDFAWEGVGNYDVASDRRFVLVRRAEAPPRHSMNIVLGWFDELHRRVASTRTGS